KTQVDVRVVDDQTGSPTSANDLAKAILDILAQLGREGSGSRAGIYHLTGRGETTWHAFASAIFAGWAQRGRKPVKSLIAIKSEQYLTLARRPANSRLDCTKIEHQFGIQLPPWQRSLDACLDRLLVEA